MKKIFRRTAKVVVFLLLIALGATFVLAYFPFSPIVQHNGISQLQATAMRKSFSDPHVVFNATDGEELFLRKWMPESTDDQPLKPVILVLHGITAHSGAYATAAEIMANAGYTVYGLDYRGHGISGGNRADSTSKQRWIKDLSETVQFLKGLGHPEVIVFGHSLGVASAILTAMAIPDQISGLILLSGAKEGRPGVSTPPSFFQTTRILASSLLRPSFQVVEYHRDGMTGMDDPLFNFKYTLRFLGMLEVKDLALPETLNVPVLVGVGDKDELFETDKVKLLYDEVPGDRKEFLIFNDTYHAKFPDESWNEVAAWIQRNFPVN